jgi:hypothetical protein
MKTTNLFLVSILTLSIQILSAQDKILTDEKGTEYILHEDGTWNRKEAESIDERLESDFDRAPTCEYASNEIDEFTGIKKLVTTEVPFFQSTPEGWTRRGGREYLIASVQFTSFDGEKGILFFFKVNSDDVYEEVGYIEKGRKILFKFKDGSVEEMIFMKSDSGRKNHSRENTLFGAYTVFEESQFERLLNSEREIEKVRVHWSKGFQDYDVNTNNFLFDYLKCIE